MKQVALFSIILLTAFLPAFTYVDVIKINGKVTDAEGYKKEFIELLNKAKKIDKNKDVAL